MTLALNTFTYVCLVLIALGLCGYLAEQFAKWHFRKFVHGTLSLVVFLSLVAVYVWALKTMSEGVSHWLRVPIGSPAFLLVMLLMTVPVTMASINHGKYYTRCTDWLAAWLGIEA